MKRVLSGLKTSDYMHPGEKEIHRGIDSALVKQTLDKVGDLNAAVLQRMTLGKYVEITEQTAPRIYGLVREVCQTLDCPVMPRVYVCHQASQNFDCMGSENMMIIRIADYMFHNFDEDMLRFQFGNLISMFKAGHIRLLNVYELMLGGVTKLIEIPLLACIRAADMTSDRAGVLACQNFSGAAKMILWEAGIPLSELVSLDEKELIQLSRNYIEETEKYQPDWVNMTMTAWQKLNLETMPHSCRLKDLLQWYEEDYPELMSRWREES